MKKNIEHPTSNAEHQMNGKNSRQFAEFADKRFATFALFCGNNSAFDISPGFSHIPPR